MPHNQSDPKEIFITLVVFVIGVMLLTYVISFI
jgi:hypothetical protein